MRRKERVNIEWETPPDNSSSWTWDTVQLEVLMDIRSELQRLNRVFACHNAQAIPKILRNIERNTKKTKRRKK